MEQKRVLIIYYSHSAQTRKLIQAFSAGLQENGVSVCLQQLKPLKKLQFPVGSVLSTLKMMVETFFRKRIEIEEPDQINTVDLDLIVLAGPTWSYNPSGPILKFFDDYGGIFARKKVLPFISCRSYWRMHSWQLKYILKKKGAQVFEPLVFLHTGVEPWRTIGVFLKMAGKMPESEKSWLSKYYTRFGHTRGQVDLAKELGKTIGANLQRGKCDLLVQGKVIKDPNV